jgi:hypothetical protein
LIILSRVTVLTVNDHRTTVPDSLTVLFLDSLVFTVMTTWVFVSYEVERHTLPVILLLIITVTQVTQTRNQRENPLTTTNPKVRSPRVLLKTQVVIVQRIPISC